MAGAAVAEAARALHRIVAARLNPMLTTTAQRPISILLGALGGQGGGVLTDWIVEAATQAGYAAQATSIPGVAQRTGATTYYIEVFPQRAADTERTEAAPVFSLYPMPGDVDIIIAGEFLEAARMMEMDFASPARTTLLASSHRLYAIGEKSALGDGIFPRERIEQTARTLTRHFVAFDALAAARRVGSEANAVLLGALAAMQVLPLAPADFEAAIRAMGVATERNLAGFAEGLRLVSSPPTVKPAPDVAESQTIRATPTGARAAALLKQIAAEFPASLHALLKEAVSRLIDYQDEAYALDLLKRVQRLRAVNQEQRLTEIFVRRLAVWMTYEDAIRVAEFKIRRARFERMRQEHNVRDGMTMVVTDYLKPDLDELYGLLPVRLAAPIARWAERRWPQGRPTIAQHVKTTAVTGFLRVWLLTRLRFLRPASLRRQREFAVLERWEENVLTAAALDVNLACEVVELAALVKGYGEVRRRLTTSLIRFLNEIVTPAIARERAEGAGYTHATQLVHAARVQMLRDENGIDAVLQERGDRAL
jgi:indolepyruvate ferredoxin oxidoreductase beta subunit